MREITTIIEEEDNSSLRRMEEGQGMIKLSESILGKIARANLQIKNMNGESTSLRDSLVQSNNVLKVPDWLRSSNIKDLYEPSVVSIGPYHRNNHRIQEIQQHKWVAVAHLFKNGSNMIANCLKKLKDLEDPARTYYDGDVIKHLTSDEFLEMMLTDGCFIISFLTSPLSFEIFRNKDDIFAAIEEVMDDLLLMDNQIPLSILQAISGECINVEDSTDLNNYIYHRDVPILWKFASQQFGKGDASKEFDNLLELYYYGIVTRQLEKLEREYHETVSSYYLNKNIQEGRCFRYLSYYLHIYVHFGRGIFSLILNPFSYLSHLLLKKIRQVWDEILSCFPLTSQYYFCKKMFQCSCTPRLPCFYYKMKRSERNRGEKLQFVVHSATSLRDRGVILKQAVATILIQEVTLSRDGIMKIPRISIEDVNTMNLLAFEQCKYLGSRKKMHISKTIYFIACMVKTAKDLELLQSCGIIEIGNKYGEDNAMELIKMFRNNIQLNMEARYTLHDMCQHINLFMTSRRSQWRAKLMKDYFSNPWSILSLLAALILLLLTFLQTFFAMYSYFHPPSSPNSPT